MLKKFMAALLAVCLLLTTMPTAMLAGDGDGIGGDEIFKIEDISVNPSTVIEENTSTSLSIKYILKKGFNDSFSKDERFSVTTNIGELFSADWDGVLKNIAVTGENNEELGFITITKTEVIFTVGEALVGAGEFSGELKTEPIFKGLDQGATDTASVKKNLQIGDKKAEVEFKNQPTKPDSSGATIDLDWFWKSVGPSNPYLIPADDEDNPTDSDIQAGVSAGVSLEVNSMGSFDLYGHLQTNKTPEIYEQLFVKDPIPGEGIIDEKSVDIIAIVPVIAVTDHRIGGNYGYYIEAGTFYPQRSGSQWYSVREKIGKVVQNPGETLQEYEERLRDLDIGWGIYYDESTNTQTFMCNFGRVGDPEDNNEIFYKDLGAFAQGYVEKYPGIFGDEGPTGGNVVSYHIQFQTYYPEIETLTQLRNKAYMSTADNPYSYNEKSPDPYWISQVHSTSTGVAKRNDVVVKLVDEDDKSVPIEGADFIIQVKNDEGGWETTSARGTTDDNGRLVFHNITKGDYRLVQLTSADGYIFNNETYGSSGVSIMNNIASNGEFTVTGNEAYGYGTVVTNKKINDPDEDTITVTFDQNYDVEPSTWWQVQLTEEQDCINDVSDGAWPTNPSRDGYTFLGWNTEADGSGAPFEATTPVSKDITVYAQWKQVEFVTLTPEDQTIYTGGVDGSDENHEFPHPIYLLGDKALDENTTFRVKGVEWNNETYEYPFTVKYYDGDEEITDDKRYGDYTARIVPVAGVALDDITTSTGQPLKFGEGTLRIRYVSSFTEASDNALTSDAVLYTGASDKATARDKVEATDKAGVILPASSEIYLNGNPDYVYSADGPGKIALLFDELLPASADGNSTDLVDDLIARAAEEGYDIQDSNTMFRYLDLVDTNDSNAWVSASEGSDVFWPYPEGCDRNDDIRLLHFTDLHREYRMEGEASLAEQIAASDVENVAIEKTANGIWFHVDESGFSPFVLVWDEKNDHPHWPPVGPGDDDDDPSEDPEEPDTPDDLNTVDHFSYVVGYPEDYRTGEPTDNEDLWPVKPQGDITRAEVATIFYRLLKADVRDENTTDVSDFSDVSSSDWYGTTVATLAEMNIVEGYEDGTFRPNAPITRAEFAAIATRFFEKTGATYEPGTFTDVTGDEWFAGAIMDAVNLGLIGGYEDGTVRPNNNITRAEACAIVNRTLGRVPDADHLLPADEMKTWPDNPETAWYYADMQEATNGHEYEWITDDGSRVEDWTGPLDKDWTSRSAN